MLTKEKLEKIKKNVGKFVKIEVYHIHDLFHDDDIDHRGNTELLRGQLDSVTPDGITVSGRFLKFFKTDEGWYSRNGEAITLILCGKDVLYNSYNIVPKDIKHKHKL